MTYTASLSKARMALLATAAFAGLALAPQAANATSYALTAVDVENLQFTGINAFLPPFSFTANSSADRSDLLLNPSSSKSGTTADLNANLQNIRTSTGAVALGNLGFTSQSAGALPAQGPGGNYSTSQSAITSTSTNTANDVNARGSWRGTAEASVNGTSGVTGADATSQQRLVWGLTLSDPAVRILHLDFDVSFLAAASVTGSNLNGTATSSYTLSLAFTGNGVNQPTDFLTVLNTTTPNPKTNADLNVGNGCNKAGVSAIAGDTHIHCDFTISNISAPDQLTLTDVETVTVTAAAVPEPATLSIIGAGLLGLGAAARRRRAQKAA